MWRICFRNVRKCLPNKFKKQNYLRTQLFSKNSIDNENNENFNNVMRRRRIEANRSIVVQVNSEKSFPELYNYCKQFGVVIGAHHYKLQHEEFHYILIEFENESVANEAINSSCYNDDLSGIPARSSFLWFKANNGKKSAKLNHHPQPKNPLRIIDGTSTLSEIDLNVALQSAEILEDQILILYRSTCLNDLGSRMRFLAARQVETSISGLFPYANARPFGSSVNGFGRMGCDLDLILRFDDEERDKNAESSRFVFHTKENLSNGRSQVQRQMESIGDMLHLFVPGVCHVRRILQARIPIIKFHHEHLNLEVDLSMSNLSGLYMSELLYLFGQIDSRVRPLVFCIRKWAQSVGLTNPSPGRWITNFSLTCLVIFFLQQLKTPILPPVNYLCKSASKDDIRVTEDGINCTFLRDCNNLHFQKKNTQKISELLLQFFEFYSQFDFNNRAISLNEGHSILKADHSAMYIVNPLEQILNVSKNVSMEECERLRIEVRNAAWILESEIDGNLIGSEIREEPWGLQNLFKTPERAIIRPNLFFKPRMVDVSELFEEKYKDRDSLQRIEYRNQSVRKQIRSIRAKGKADLKQMKLDAEATEELTMGKQKGKSS